MKPQTVLYRMKYPIGSFSLLFFLALSVVGLLLTSSCGRPKVGELSGVVQLDKTTNSEGILLFIPGTEYRAYTDENGSFLITSLPPGTHTIVAQYEGFEEARQSVIIQAGKTTTIGPLFLQKPILPQGTLSGFITLEGETNHQDVLVLLVNTTFTASTNTTGYFEMQHLPPGEYQLIAFKDNWSPASKSQLEVKDGQETQVPTIELRMIAPEPTPLPLPPTLGEFLLQGSAFLEGEENHAGIRVALVDLPEKFTVTDASGTFSLTGLDEKTHSLILSHDGFLNETIPKAAPVSATSTNSCGFVTLQKEFQPGELGVLQGRVYLEGQETHDNITVHLQGVASPPVFTDTEGRYRFVGVPASKYVLTADHPGYENGRIEEVEIKANQFTQAPDLTLHPTQEEPQGTGAIIGLALLEGETDQGGILVAIEGTTFSAVTGLDGNFTFEKVPVGAYSLIYTKSGFKNYYLYGVPVVANQNTALEPVILAKDVEPPVVVDSFPRIGARKIPIDQFIDVIIRFSERMDGRSVKQAVVIEPQVGFEAFFDRESELSDLDTLHIRLYHQPPIPLAFNTDYRVIITPEARTPKGVPMAEPFILTFNTDGPMIVDSIPNKRETLFSLNMNRKLLLVTNAPVDQSTFERSLRIRPQPDTQPIIEFIPMGLGTQITIEADWRANTRYRVQIDNSMRTMDRQRFSNVPFSLNFRTVYEAGFDQPQPGGGRAMRSRIR